MKTGEATPAIGISLGDIVDPAVQVALRSLFRSIGTLQTSLARVINANAIVYVAQNDKPAPSEGQWIIWKDTNAIPGNPLGYLITVQDGQTYTFLSDELA